MSSELVGQVRRWSAGHSKERFAVMLVLGMDPRTGDYRVLMLDGHNPPAASPGKPGVVVVHEKPWLRLLAVRDRANGAELSVEEYWGLVKVSPVRSFPLGSFEEIAASFEHISPVSQEGYVVVDGQGRRVKVKHPGYVALHHAKDGMGPKAFVRIAQSGETPEVIASFPEFAPLLEDMRRRYVGLCAAVDEAYARIIHIPDCLTDSGWERIV